MLETGREKTNPRAASDIAELILATMFPVTFPCVTELRDTRNDIEEGSPENGSWYSNTYLALYS
jgi:hypothetical protein